MNNLCYLTDHVNSLDATKKCSINLLSLYTYENIIFQTNPQCHLCFLSKPAFRQRYLPSLSIMSITSKHMHTKKVLGGNPNVSNLIRRVFRQVAVCRQIGLIQETVSTREINSDKVPGANMKQLGSSHIFVQVCICIAVCVSQLRIF